MTIPDDVPSWQQAPIEFTPPHIWAHLGPDPYVKQQLCDLGCGCREVVVTGSQVEWCGDNILLATCLTSYPGCTNNFRTALGTPVWPDGWRGWSPATVASSVSPFGSYQNIYGCVDEVPRGGMPGRDG